MLSRQHIRSPGPVAPIVVFVLALGSCRGAPEKPDEAVGAVSPPEWVETLASESPQWVDAYVPELAEPGYTLVLYRRRRPVLLDMDGSVVHYWPDVRGASRARLLPTGHLLLKTDHGDMAEYDWNGQRTWSFASPEGGFLHHDFALLRNGNYLLLFHDREMRSDRLLEISRSGEEVWRWESSEHIGEDFLRRGRNWTHINSVQELPPNRWFDLGHEEFRPGNILISSRALSTLYIISRPGGEAVWRYSERLDFQHEARMMPPGFPGAGNIFFFNNRYHSIKHNPRSTLAELDPVSRSVVWRYGSPGFFSSSGGTQQCLPGGNLLVTTTRGGRIFELTREGRIVWQWSPPYLPMRALRYAPDHCPQLAALAPPSARAVWRRDPARFVDHEVYKFKWNASREVTRDGKKVSLLRRSNPRCSRLLLPDNAELHLGYGIDRQGLGEARSAGEGRFRVTIQAEGTDERQTLLERTARANGAGWEEGAESLILRRETLPLARYGFKRVDFCLTVTDPSGTPSPAGFVWETPLIRAVRHLPTDDAEAGDDARASAHQMEQLRALGYVE